MQNAAAVGLLIFIPISATPQFQFQFQLRGFFPAGLGEG
jgi:hypothetical protein